jgi:hypothetical protein
MDKNLRLAIKNLEQDDIKIKIIGPSASGDNKIIISSKHWKTIIAANDLGVWLEKQVADKTMRDSRKNNKAKIRINYLKN